MKPSSRFISTLLFFLCVAVFPINAAAEDLINYSSSIFKFQQRLADKGNVSAQYKLATMYERGDGVVASIDQAKHWYKRAASAGSKSAEYRGTYLEVKEQGYQQAKHGDWLNSVISDSNAHNGDAMLLHGQLYCEGLGVNKDLYKSLKLLQEVKILGVADVDAQIADIEAEIQVAKKAELARNELARKKKSEAANVQLTKAEPAIKKESELVNALPSKAELAATEEAELAKAKLIKAEKRRKYEAVMLKLKQEQALIDGQQAWSTGGGAATVDDEI